MYGVLMQEYTSVSGDPTVPSVVQGEDFWLNTGPYQDAIFWIDVKSVITNGAATLNLSVETAPSKDDSAFLPCVPGFSISAATAPVVKLALMSSGAATSPPISNWIRWKLSPGSGGTAPRIVTFRIWVSLNSPGM